MVTVEIVMQRFDRRMNLLSCNSLLPHCTNTWTPWTPWRLGLPRSRLRLTAVEWWKDELFLRRLCSVRTGVDVLRILGRADRRICYWRYDFVRWKQLSQYVRSQNHVCIVWRSYG